MKRTDFLATFPLSLARAIEAQRLPKCSTPGRHEVVDGVMWFEYDRALVIRVDGAGAPATSEKTEILSTFLRTIPALTEHSRVVIDWARECTVLELRGKRSVSREYRVVPVGSAFAKAGLLRVVEQLYPSCEWHVYGDDLDPIVASSYSQIVAAVMPLRR